MCNKPYFSHAGSYVIDITWARGIYLIYTPKPEDHRPKGVGIYVRQIPSAHVLSEIHCIKTKFFNRL